MLERWWNSNPLSRSGNQYGLMREGIDSEDQADVQWMVALAGYKMPSCRVLQAPRCILSLISSLQKKL